MALRSIGRASGKILSRPYAAPAAALVGLAASAILNRELAKRAEKAEPPLGRFVAIDGVRLHYTDRGAGDALVLLHGKGAMAQDFESSGLIDIAAENFRVIAFDRPGYGYSQRPRDRIWSPSAQADLLSLALQQIGISRATVLGHSWGALVAIALSLRDPRLVRGLVLASGYYFPSLRADVLNSGPAAPLIGDILKYTAAPLLSRAAWPFAVRRLFSPCPVSDKFRTFPKEMALRPSQLQASAAESALMIPAAAGMQSDYEKLKMPVVIIAGADDRIVNTSNQSGRLHEMLTESVFRKIPGIGHMVHYSATDAVMSAIYEASSVQDTRSHPGKFLTAV